MTTTRVTVASIACSGLPAIRSTSGALAAVQEHMSSGTKIVAPSDNPGGTVRAMSLDSERSRNDKYATNSADALAWLSSVDTAYCQAVSVLQQARTLVLQGLNAGANSASTNEALAQQVDKMRSSLPSVANMVDVPRPDVLGSGTSDVFALLSSISSALRTSPSSLSSSSLGRLDAAIGKIAAAHGAAGATYQQVDRAQSAQVAKGTAMNTELSGIADVDPAETAVRLTTANSAYQAALRTTESIRQLSLLDFLR